MMITYIEHLRVLFCYFFNDNSYSELGGKNMEIIKVSSTSVPNHVAGAIASLMREQDKLK